MVKFLTVKDWSEGTHLPRSTRSGALGSLKSLAGVALAGGTLTGSSSATNRVTFLPLVLVGLGGSGSGGGGGGGGGSRGADRGAGRMSMGSLSDSLWVTLALFEWLDTMIKMPIAASIPTPNHTYTGTIAKSTIATASSATTPPNELACFLFAISLSV